MVRSSFGLNFATVQNDAAKAFDKWVLVLMIIWQYMNKMGSLMKGSGIDTQKAMNLSSKLCNEQQMWLQ